MRQSRAVANEKSTSAMHLLAPVIAFGATWGMRKVVNGGYRQIVGSAPPDPLKSSTPLVRAIVWAATTAALAAVVEVAIYRLTDSD
jgi:hypothetical protein